MKKLLSFFALLFLAFNTTNAQTTYIANNNPAAVSGVNVFTGATALTDAIAATVNGDIIYVIPSGIDYGNMGSITTEITVTGVGLNPDQATPVKSLVTNVSINTSNLRLTGLIFTRPASDGSAISFGGTFANIMIDNCRFARLTSGSDIANLVLQNNIMGHSFGGTGAGTVNVTPGTTGVRIANNIIYGSTSTVVFADGWLQDMTGAVIENNVFIGNISGSNQRLFRSANNSNIKNNIFYGVRITTTTGTFTNNTFEYNISFGANVNSFPTTNGNTSTNDLVNVDPLFVNILFGNSWSNSYDPNLQAGSQGLGTGEAGTDRGVFGGGSPLDLTFTSIPTINSLTLPPTVSQGDDLPINIKGKGN